MTSIKPCRRRSPPYPFSMRAFLLFLLTALPAHAWEATLGPVCTLTHETESAYVLLTYDPSEPRYSIAITRKGGPWPNGSAFQMLFDGPAPLAIGTDRHILSDGGRTLTVTDRGFGNVLNGLQFNGMARATTGGLTESFSLTGAAGPVQAFRDCPPFTGA